jgi:hypothetical protein
MFCFAKAPDQAIANAGGALILSGRRLAFANIVSADSIWQRAKPDEQSFVV